MRHLMRTVAGVMLVLTTLSARAEEVVVAPTIRSITGAELQALLQGWGYRADLSTDELGDPIIQSAAAGIDYTITFYGCTADAEPRRCTSLTFLFGLDFTDGIEPTTVNAWNMSRRFGRAYTDEELDPWLEWDILLDGGIALANLEAQVAQWDRTVGSFLDATGW